MKPRLYILPKGTGLPLGTSSQCRCVCVGSSESGSEESVFGHKGELPHSAWWRETDGKETERAREQRDSR
ncbi:hypothetical protein INR49_004222 [Caranx melampygus]|nr:hypothetical protein INR49_004222 [Caranx melampygus]